MSACPCCGGELPQLPLSWSKETRTLMRDGHAVQLAPQQARVFDVIWRAHPVKLSCGAVRDRAWVHDRDGGPGSSNVVSVYMVLLNKKLKPLRVRVGGRMGAREDVGMEVGA